MHQNPLIEELEAKLKKPYQYRWVQERAWFQQYLFFLGHQWVHSRPGGGALDALYEPEDRVRFRDNRYKVAVLHRVALLTKNIPDPDVDTDLQSVKAIHKRKLAEKVLEYWWDKEDMGLRFHELATLGFVAGTSFLMPYWDPHAGEEYDPAEFLGEESIDEDLQNLADVAFDGDHKALERWVDGKESVRKGDMRVEVLSPFEVMLDESRGDVRGASWALVNRLRSVDQVRELYPDHADEIQPESIPVETGPAYLMRLKALLSPNMMGVASTYGEIEESVLLKEYWERPSRKHPRGRRVVWASGVLLENGDNPYWDCGGGDRKGQAAIPLVRFRTEIVPGSFWGQSFGEQFMPIQRLINRILSETIENFHNHNQAKWLVPMACALDPGALNRNSNEVVIYGATSLGNGTYTKPERVPPVPLPQWHFNLLELAYQAANDISGVHDPSKGASTMGATSGAMLQIMMQPDETRNGAVLAEYYSAFAEFWRLQLEIGKKFITDRRFFREIVGEDEEGAVADFTGEDLEFRSLRVKPGSLMNRDRMVQQQHLMEILQYGGAEFFGQQGARDALFKAVGLRQDFVDETSVHEKRALHENEAMDKGELVHPEQWHDSALHLKVHNLRRNDLSYDRLPDEAKMAYELHCKQHEQLVMQAQMQAMQQMMAQGGLPPSGAGAVPVGQPEVAPASPQGEAAGPGSQLPPQAD